MSVGELVIMRKISLVALLSSAASSSSCACESIVCFSFAIDSAEDGARTLRLVFLEGFFFIYKKTRLETQSGLI
jgi:hypothetical protein